MNPSKVSNLAASWTRSLSLESIWGFRKGLECGGLGTDGGVVRSWSIKRLPDEDKWNVEQLDAMIGLPWQLRPKPAEQAGMKSIPLEVELPKEVIIEEEKPAEVVVRRKKGYVPRGIYIRRDVELEEFGFTDGCDGCDRAKHGLSHRQHSRACKQRISEELSKTAEGRNRLEQIKDREERYIVAVGEKAEEERKRSGEGGLALPEKARREGHDEVMDATLGGVPMEGASLAGGQGGHAASSSGAGVSASADVDFSLVPGGLAAGASGGDERLFDMDQSGEVPEVSGSMEIGSLIDEDMCILW